MPIPLASFFPRLFPATFVLLASTIATAALASANPDENGARDLKSILDAWGKAGCPGEESDLGNSLSRAARAEGRMDIVEQVLAGGAVLKRMIPIPRTCVRVPLLTIHRFSPVKAMLSDEMFASIQNPENGWLARRITADRIEVWTPNHGWLFDGGGHLLHEASVQRQGGTGRQWYGAFLPDGRWVTTDLDEYNGTLYFYSSDGKRSRKLTCDQLAPPPLDTSGTKLLAWARSDKSGSGWVVNVGSEGGWATVWVGPKGPARILKDYERWQFCYPRALGARDDRVPDDNGDGELGRSEASHGPGVGYPTYSFRPSHAQEKSDAPEAASWSHTVPNGNDVFGFWPKSRVAFVGSDGNNVDELHFFNHSEAKLADYEPSGIQTRKFDEIAGGARDPIIDKTWIFAADGHLAGWIRARRIGDAADGRSLLLRATADSRVVTLDSKLTIRAVRHFTWSDDSTADAVIIWDDLQIGLFVRNIHLVLARWGTAASAKPAAH